MLADEVVGQPDIVESIDLDHDVVEAAALRTDTEGDGVVAIVAVHEDGRDDIFAHAELVFDATAHPEGGVEALRSRRIILADDAVAEAARGAIADAGFIPPDLEMVFPFLFGRPVLDQLRRLAPAARSSGEPGMAPSRAPHGDGAGG